jgi:hypothetical protein
MIQLLAPPSLSRQQVVSFSQCSYALWVELTDGRGGAGGREYNRKKAWSSIYHYYIILSYLHDSCCSQLTVNSTSGQET